MDGIYIRTLQNLLDSHDGTLIVTSMKETYPPEAEKVMKVERIKVQTASAIPHSAYYDKNGKFS